MKTVRIGIMSLVILTLVLSGCSSSEKSVATPTPLKELTAKELYDQISPSIAYVETPTGSGSGFLITGGYVVTCAHVVWPFENVSVVFPNSSKLQTQVLNYDLLADIAVLGPVTVNASPLMLTEHRNMSIGDPVFAIGYPLETERLPTPTLSQGILSRLRDWDSEGVTYIQTDAAVEFGQSGGVLLSNKGELLGMTGYSYGENYALAISAADLSSRAGSLISGNDIAGLGSRRLPLTGGQKKSQITLGRWWEEKPFVIRQAEDTKFNMQATSTRDIALLLTNANGYWIDDVDDNVRGTESLSAMLKYGSPNFLIVSQHSTSEAIIQLNASCDLIPLNDPDDGKIISIGDTIFASLDYPADWDYYPVNLSANQTIVIAVDSLMIDSYISVSPADFKSLPDDDYQEWEDDEWQDDDSGSGLSGANAYFEFTAPVKGTYIIVVSDAYDENIGGYILTVGEGGTPTKYSTTSLGEACFSYPAGWNDVSPSLEQALIADNSSYKNYLTAKAWNAPSSAATLITVTMNLDKIPNTSVPPVLTMGFKKGFIAGATSTFLGEMTDQYSITHQQDSYADGEWAYEIELTCQINGIEAKGYFLAVFYGHKVFIVIYVVESKDWDTLGGVYDKIKDSIKFQ